jgi:hypothetical protein
MNPLLIMMLLQASKKVDDELDWMTEGDMTFLLIVWILGCSAIMALDVWMLWPVIENLIKRP